MNDNTLYTRCPTCSTAFKVTDEFLDLAGGKARCGACLAVFQATDYMLRPSRPRPSTVLPTKSEAKQTNIERSRSESDNRGSDNLEPSRSEPAEKRSTHGSIHNGIQESSGGSLATAKLDSFDESDDMPDGLEEEIDLLGSLDDLQDKENESFDMDEPSEKDDPSTQEVALDPNVTSNDNIRKELSRKELSFNKQECGIKVEQEEAANGSITTEDDLSTPIDEVVLAEQEPTIEDSGWDGDDISLDEFDEDLDGEFEEGDAKDIEENLEELSVQLFEQMEETDTDPDPLDEFDDIVKSEKEGIKLKLILASVGILVFIAVWQFWSNRQSLAWSSNWATATKAVCNYLPCNLKPQRDVSKIKLLQRQLSPDEDEENYLDIKVLLMNEANFDQPYPTIKIIFSNKDGQPVTVKSFGPRDYLDTDADSARMPSGSEVHIRFKTEVTHPDALGFEFKFE